MYACDGCDEWYHYRCLQDRGILPGSRDDFYCGACPGSSSGSSASAARGSDSIASEPPHPYGRMRKMELEDLCLERGLPKSGKKNDLVARLIAVDNPSYPWDSFERQGKDDRVLQTEADALWDQLSALDGAGKRRGLKRHPATQDQPVPKNIAGYDPLLKLIVIMTTGREPMPSVDRGPLYRFTIEPPENSVARVLFDDVSALGPDFQPLLPQAPSRYAISGQQLEVSLLGTAFL